MTKWIKTSDELPADSSDILIFADSMQLVGYYDHMWKKFRQTRFYLTTDAPLDDTVTDKVTHWMPLPPMPEVE